MTNPERRKRSWLITGGCGFIGRSLIRELIASDEAAAIWVYDNLSVGTRDDLREVCRFRERELPLERSAVRDGEVQLCVGDVRDGARTTAIAKCADVIVHLAANTGVAPSVEDPWLDLESNVVGTFNVLEGARHGGVERVVFASSGAPLGEVDPPIHEKLAPRPVSPYGASKLAGEAYCSAYYRTFGVETVALRFGNVYGPLSGHKSSAVAKFVRCAMGGQSLEIYGDGRQTRDFIYIGDLVRAIRAAAATPGIGGEVYQIATGRETTVQELVDALLPVLAEQGIAAPDVLYSSPRQGDVLRNYSDTSKAAAQLGWRTEVSLPEGLSRTVQWFLSRQGSPPADG